MTLMTDIAGGSQSGASIDNVGASRSKAEEGEGAFMIAFVEYSGHCISAERLCPTHEKVRAIMNAPQPENVTQLQSILELVNYWGKYLPNYQASSGPLYSLLQKGNWIWKYSPKRSHLPFKEQLISPCLKRSHLPFKEQLISPCLLVHYDPEKLSRVLLPPMWWGESCHTKWKMVRKVCCFCSYQLRRSMHT